jgi:hypothetical protein
MRYFFNGGGYVTFTGVNSNITGNTKSTDWDGVLGNGSNTGAGYIRIRSQTSEKVSGGSTSSPSVFNGNAGFYDLTTAGTAILRQYSTNALGGYNNNYVDFTASLNVAHPNATALIVNMKLNDASTPDTFDDTVLGTVQLDASFNPPPATLSNVWLGVTTSSVFVGQS